MPYLGNSPSSGGYHKLDSLTASATDTYALTLGGSAYYPATANQLLVSLNGVIQAPQDSFTISGSNIVFASALSASDSIDFIMSFGDVYGVGTPADGTITNAKIQSMAASKLTGALPAIDGSALTGVGSNVLEQLALVCNGESITVPSGTYTPANVTSIVALTDTHTEINGSSIAYTPPSGATSVIYEFSCVVNWVNTGGIYHMKMQIDGTDITATKQTHGLQGNYDKARVNFKWRIPIGGSDSNTTGRRASWTSAKTVRLTMRRYNSSYNGNLFEALYWDGATAGFVEQPILSVTAYK